MRKLVTRLDALTGGVNDVLAARLELQNVEPFGVDPTPIGRVGELEYPMSLEAFAERVKLALHASAASLPFSAVISARPKGMAQPAEVPVISFPSVTAAAQTILALPICASQPG